MCALPHDNALTQYISEELKKDSVIDLKKDLSEEKTNLHCIYGCLLYTSSIKKDVLPAEYVKILVRWQRPKFTMDVML